MRLQFPTRVSLPKVFVYAVAVFVAQQYLHTSLEFSLLYFALVILTAVAFNTAGGFSRPMGSYVCWYFLLICGVGVTWKNVLGEPGDSNLKAPLVDMGAYACSMLMLLVVVIVVRHFDLRRHAFVHVAFKGPINYRLVTVGCFVMGVGILLGNEVFSATQGSLLAALNQLNGFFQLGMIFGTIDAIRESHGKKSFNALSLCCFVPTFVTGVVGYSKQGMLTPILCWIVAAMYCRLQLTKMRAAFLVACGVFAFSFVSVWSVGRDEVPDGGLRLIPRIELAILELQHFDNLKQHAEAQSQLDKEYESTGYFSEEQGLLDRLSIIGADDGLFAYSDQGHYEGYYPVFLNFVNWIPHFIYPNKPGAPGGNYYAHEMGVLRDEDTTTGISFSPPCEAYHLGGWVGLMMVLPLIWLMMFESVDLVVGDMRDSPWGLLVVVYFAHSAPEGGVGGNINYTYFGNLSMIVAIFFCARIAPVLGKLLLGRGAEKSSARATQRLRQPRTV